MARQEGGSAMQLGVRGVVIGLGVAAAAALVWMLGMPVSGQAQTYRAPRTADGKPNFNGIWQAVNTANWDIQDHAARQGPVVALGAAFSIPGGLGVVEGNEIPYKPEALKQKQENAATWLTTDPELPRHLPAAPRPPPLPYPLHLVPPPPT